MALYFDALTGSYGDTAALYILDDELTDVIVHIVDSLGPREALRVARVAGITLDDVLESYDA